MDTNTKQQKEKKQRKPNTKSAAKTFGALLCTAVVSFVLGFSYCTFKETGAFTRLPQNEAQGNIQNDATVTAKTIRIAPDAEFIFIKNYQKSGKTVSVIQKTEEQYVGADIEEIKSAYPQWSVDSFSVKKVVLTRDIDSYAPDTYMLSIATVGGEERLTLYRFTENGDKLLTDTYETPPEIFTEEERLRLSEGIIIDSEEQLERVLQNYAE